ncbi:MAG: ATP-binding protein [Terriglobia bacterium]
MRSGKPHPQPHFPSDPDLLGLLLDAAATPLFALDPQDRLFFANRAWADLVGVSPEAMAGKTVAELVEMMGGALPHPAEYEQRVVGLARDPALVSLQEVEYRTDRRLVFRELSQPLLAPGGKLRGRLFLYLDVTREKELEQKKNEFLSIAAHELRTPMTSIKGSLDLLLGGFAGEVSGDTRELLTIAQNGCERLIRLINDLLDLSKIEAGRMVLRRVPMNLFDSAQRSVRTIRSYADSFKVKVELEAPGVLPPIQGDRDRLDQVITNLLANAVRFSPGTTVRVRVRAVDDTVECRVIDQGPGIAADQRERIFEKFLQLDASGKKKGGTGLGLTIARALVEEHGGKIWVESELGRGSEFVFQLPRLEPDAH